jgi:ParB family chromosome partitioning protein
LPDFAKERLNAGDISEGHARQVLALDSKKDQQELVEKIMKQGYSVRDAEKFVATRKTITEAKKEKQGRPFEKIVLSPTEKKNVCSKLAKKFVLNEKHVKVSSSGAKLKLTIEFSTASELEKFQSQL